MVENKLQKSMLMIAGTASMIDQFNMSNINLLLSMGYKVNVACNFLPAANFREVRNVINLSGGFII